MYSYLMQNPDYISPALPHSGALRKRVKLRATLRAWLGRILHRWTRQRTIAALHALDDRTLGDIGLTRSDIPALVKAPDLVERGAGPSTPRDFEQTQPYALTA